MTVTGSWSGAPLRVLAVLGAVALVVLLLPAPTPAWGHEEHADAACPDEPATFTDRDEIAAVHLPNVDCVSAHGIVAGFEDGTYRPAAGVRRDQLATFLFRTLQQAGADLPAADTERFSDVAAGSAHDEAIHRLKAAGVAQGAGGGAAFGPSTLIRRDQLVSFLARGIDHAYPGTVALDEQRATRFADVPAGNVHSGNVEQTADLGIVQGFGPDTFGPSAGTRRDQLATFMVRLLELLAGLGGDEPGTPEPTLTVALSQSFAAPDVEVTATATLEHDGEAVEGVDVSFAASGAAPDPSSGSAMTGPDGAATFAFSSTETGLVTVTATATHAGASLSGQAQVVYSTGSPEDQFTLVVEPATVEVGDTVTATATITTSSGAPVSGRAVEFTTDGAATSPDAGGDTTAAGQATFTFTATEAGAVTVTARALLNPHHAIVPRTATVEVH